MKAAKYTHVPPVSEIMSISAGSFSSKYLTPLVLPPDAGGADLEVATFFGGSDDGGAVGLVSPL